MLNSSQSHVIVDEAFYQEMRVHTECSMKTAIESQIYQFLESTIIFLFKFQDFA